MTITGEDIAEYEALDQLVRCDGWRVVRNMLSTYKNDMQEEVNIHLRAGNIDKARACLAARDGAVAFIAKVNDREKYLAKQK